MLDGCYVRLNFWNEDPDEAETCKIDMGSCNSNKSFSDVKEEVNRKIRECVLSEYKCNWMAVCVHLKSKVFLVADPTSVVIRNSEPKAPCQMQNTRSGDKEEQITSWQDTVEKEIKTRCATFTRASTIDMIMTYLLKRLPEGLAVDVVKSALGQDSPTLVSVHTNVSKVNAVQVA